jgi:hypothetical protein
VLSLVVVCVAPGRVVCVVLVVDVEVDCELVPLAAGVELAPALELFCADADTANGSIKLSARMNMLAALDKLKVFIKDSPSAVQVDCRSEDFQTMQGITRTLLSQIH